MHKDSRCVQCNLPVSVLASLETQTVFALVHYFQVSFVLSFICFNLTAKFHASLEKGVNLLTRCPVIIKHLSELNSLVLGCVNCTCHIPVCVKVLPKRAQFRHFFAGGLWIFKQNGSSL